MSRHRTDESTTTTRTVGRRSFLALATGTVLGLAACSPQTKNAASSEPAGKLPSGPPPAGTKLTVAVRQTRLQIEPAGLKKDLAFTVSEWPNLSAGPDIIQGFRAESIDLASNAGIPPIQAKAIGVDTKIVAVQVRPLPLYTFATAPGSDIASAEDFRGKKIGFSQGQAQGVVVLRALKAAGLKNSDVELVALPSTQFLTALQSKQVDVAPLGEPTLTKYLDQYGKDGATGLKTDVVDLLTVLWAPVAVLDDPAKAAAVRNFVPLWAKGLVWAWEHQDEWIDTYYVKDQGVSVADGKRIVSSLNKPQFPLSWDKAIQWEQETADLMAEGGFVPKQDVADLFDRRFERLAAESVPAQYRESS
ncbi:ABC transporter substrate-binding protein [Streptomyces sp. ATCC51928]|uniref:ABC transporter substrate-binding protein n=1 Tax=Streptomyces caviscabies TaxID=90079 RepID=A0ABW2MFR0_9ACTN|nr:MULTISPECIES: ABC transporter substrate-binding protein [unclassified Streptomyces]MDX3341862.1 ABC transporter substrate-binding protein [Streptomyces sp. ME02-6979.5a]MDX3501919.1 ABC transporter substrate-binding protein [Streptomyces sp. ATCC51928]MDX5522961.1 ABC transporter substrate-binding protein [Streptomyces sp. DE06-01C]